MAKKTTAAEKQQRVTQVVKMLVEGAERRDIVLYASKNWGVSDRTVTSYIKSAREIITDSSRTETDYWRGVLLQRHNRVFNKAYKDGNYQAATAANREVSKIVGAYAPEKVEVISAREKVVIDLRNGKISPDAVRQRLPNIADELFREAGVEA